MIFKITKDLVKDCKFDVFVIQRENIAKPESDLIYVLRFALW
jgi:hypothetical protein